MIFSLINEKPSIISLFSSGSGNNFLDFSHNLEQPQSSLVPSTSTTMFRGSPSNNNNTDHQQFNQQQHHSNIPNTSVTNSPNGLSQNHNCLNNSTFNTTSNTLNGGGYPWLHGENGMFPSPTNITSSNQDNGISPYKGGSTGASSGAGSLSDLSGEIGGNNSFPFLNKVSGGII